jgi:hypothetical protein
MRVFQPELTRWLNLAEIEIGVRARQSLGRRRMPHLAILHHETRA